MKERFLNRLHYLLAIFLFTACSTAVPDQDELSTQVASTVIAEITATAGALPTDLPLPTATMITEPSLTPLQATEVPTLTPEPTATATETPLPTETATATLPAGDPGLTLGAPTRILGFDPNNWFLYEDTHIKMDIVAGQLELTAFLPENWEGWSTTGFHLEDFYLEITGTTEEVCQGRDRFGMIVRADHPNEGYLFGISCDGYFRLRSWDGEVFRTLIDWTASGQVRTGPEQTNRLGFMARGKVLTLFINGVEVGRVEDNTFQKGAFGIFISSAASENFMARISDVRYWELP